MANTVAAIMATATDAAQIVSREPTGIIDAIDFRPNQAGATLNSTVNFGITPAIAKSAWTPSIKTTVNDSVFGNASLTLSQAFEYPFHLTGEQIAGLSVGNYDAGKLLADMFKQAFRGCRNDIEAYLATVAKTGAHRAIGTAGTTPFASNMDVTATLKKLFEQNGAPGADLSLILDPSAAENARKLLGTPTAAGGSLAADSQRQGLLPMHNMIQLRTSVGITTHTKGTGTAYTGTGTLGSQSVVLAAGSGTMVPGDVLAIAGLTDNYVAGQAVAATGTFATLLNRPGARAGFAGAAITIGNNYTPNMALHRNSIAAVVRPPAQVPNIFLNSQAPFYTNVVVDPENGLPYGLYIQQFDGGAFFSVRAIYGAVPVNTEHIFTLMG